MISDETRAASMRTYWAKAENRARLTNATIAATPDAWTINEDVRLRSLKASGLPDRTIAEKMDRTCPAVRSRLKALRKRGWTP